MGKRGKAATTRARILAERAYLQPRQQSQTAALLLCRTELEAHSDHSVGGRSALIQIPKPGVLLTPEPGLLMPRQGAESGPHLLWECLPSPSDKEGWRRLPEAVWPAMLKLRGRQLDLITQSKASSRHGASPHGAEAGDSFRSRAAGSSWPLPTREPVWAIESLERSPPLLPRQWG